MLYRIAMLKQHVLYWTGMIWLLASISCCCSLVLVKVAELFGVVDASQYGLASAAGVAVGFPWTSLWRKLGYWWSGWVLLLTAGVSETAPEKARTRNTGKR